MTKKEIIEKYGELELKFTSYYKYTFTYEGKTEEGLDITVNYSDSDIYRDNLSATERVEKLLLGGYTSVSVGGEYIL